MLTEFTKEAIYSNILQILSLSQEGCPLLDYRISPYQTLIEFAKSFENATQEENVYVEEVLEMELMGGSYVRDFSPDYDSFEECVLYFFNDDEENPDAQLEAFPLGKILLKKINDAVAYWSGV